MENEFIWLANNLLSNLKLYQKEIYWFVGILGAIVMFLKYFKVYVDDNALLFVTRKLLDKLTDGLKKPVDERMSPLEAVGVVGTIPVALALDLVLAVVPGITIKARKKVRCKACKCVITPTPELTSLNYFCDSCIFAIDKSLNKSSVINSRLNKVDNQLEEVQNQKVQTKVQCRSCNVTNVGENGKLYLKDGILHGVCDHCWRTKYYKTASK